MTNKKMTLTWMVENFHPRYEELLEAFRDNRGGWVTYIGIETYFITLLPEALEAFARHVWDRACREQREECAMSVAGESDHTGMRFVAETDDDLRLHIINALSAPAPEFKLTEKE